MPSLKNGSLQEDAAAVITYCATGKLVSEHGSPSLAALVSAANPRDPQQRREGATERRGHDAHRGGGLPVGPARGSAHLAPRTEDGGKMASGRRKCPHRREGDAANGRPAGPGAPTRPGSSARPFPGRPRLSPRDPEVLAAAPAGGPHLPLQTEAAPAPPSHIGQGRAARSPAGPPDHTTPSPRTPPPAAAPALPFICGSRCHKMALREDARPRRPTPLPAPPAAPPRPAPRLPRHRPAPTRRSRRPPSSPPRHVRVRPTH